MGAATLLSETRFRGKDLASVTLCHRCLIKAQAAASVGLTGLSLDFAKRRALDDPSQRQGKRGVYERHLLCVCSVVLIYLDLR